MNRETEHVANMADVLAQMQRSASIHFVKALPKTALQYPCVRQTAKLALPLQFVEENGDKVEELVTLRIQTSSGRSSRSWLARVCVTATLRVYIVGGWSAFVTDNCLKKGDYVLFLLREDARSEFVVYFFRGPRGAPYFPDIGELSYEEDEEEIESDSEKEENTSKQSRLASPEHQQDEHNQDSGRDIREGNPAPLRHTENPHVPPRFSKRLVASNVGRYTGEFKTGQFEFPARFIRTYGDRVHDSVKLQGIHENSLNYVINCHRRPRNLVKVYFTPTEWSRFVHDNGLRAGHELQFSLMADSYFLVRRIS